MNKIAVIIPYFGRFPDYFPIWLKSASYNPIDYFIYTDIDMESYAIPSNVIVKHISFDNIRKQIVSKLDDSSVRLNRYYKLCEYRGAYGLIFDEDLHSYDYWGFGDVDLVWGNALLGLSFEDIFDFQKLFTRGHFCLYKNDEYSRKLFCTGRLDSFFNYNYVYHTDYECHYDEMDEWNKLIESDGLRVCRDVRYADISYHTYRFCLAERNDEAALAKQIYVWEEGRLYGFYLMNEGIKKEEKNYIHLQKRNMELRGDIDFQKPVLIAPNYFSNIRIEDITKDFIEMNNPDKKIWPEGIRRSLNNYKNKILNGGIAYKVDYLLYKRKKR